MVASYEQREIGCEARHMVAYVAYIVCSLLHCRLGLCRPMVIWRSRLNVEIEFEFGVSYRIWRCEFYFGNCDFIWNSRFYIGDRGRIWKSRPIFENAILLWQIGGRCMPPYDRVAFKNIKTRRSYFLLATRRQATCSQHVQIMCCYILSCDWQYGAIDPLHKVPT